MWEDYTFCQSTYRHLSEMGQTLFLDCCRYTQFSPYSNHHYRLIFTSGNLGNVSKYWYSHPESKDTKMGLKKFRDLGTRSGVPCASTLYGRYLQLPIYSDDRCGLVVTSGSLGNVSKDRYAYPKYRDSHSSTRENVEIFWEFFKMSTALCIPRRSPIQVLTQLNLA